MKIKKKSSVEDTLIGNLLKRRAGLRRPTVSGLKCVEKIDFSKWSDLNISTLKNFKDIINFWDEKKCQKKIFFWPKKWCLFYSNFDQNSNFMNFDQNFRSKKPSKSSNFDDFYVKIIDFDEISKKKSPAAGTLIGNLLERRAGLRRPTAPGLKCAEKNDFSKICGFRYINFEYFSKSQKDLFSVAGGFI